jgi:threonine/homoserine/homoserine lactone efflux protein
MRRRSAAMELHLPEFYKLVLFVGASMALLIVPGPAVLFIVARGISQGRAAALVSMLGIACGSLVHVVAAVAGLSALFAASAMAFSVVKYVGAAYLIYLGIVTLVKKRAAVADPRIAPKSLRRLFIDGVVVNVLNPKTAFFFVAFLPQFTHPDHFAEQALLLGLVFVILGVFSDGAYALMSGLLGGWLRGQPRLMTGQRWLTGGIFIGLGVLTAFAERGPIPSGGAEAPK